MKTVSYNSPALVFYGPSYGIDSLSSAWESSWSTSSTSGFLSGGSKMKIIVIYVWK